MDEGQESLYSEIALTSGTAWNRLHGDVTSLLTAEVELADGSSVTLPITVVRNLASDADAATRRRACRAELDAWERVATPCAAALNSIKGEANVVNSRRGWADPVDPVLFANSVDREAFDAMQAAVVESLPDWRRYLRTKARILGSAGANGGLPWWDIFAPVGDPSAASVSWDEAVATVTATFSSYSPRPGRPCPSRGGGEVDRRRGPRRQAGRCVLHGYRRGGEPGDAQLRAHLRFGVDSCSRIRPRLSQHDACRSLSLTRATPMALRGDSFDILRDPADPSGPCGHPQTGSAGSRSSNTTCRVPARWWSTFRSRFLFESQVFDRRRQRTLAASELCELMLDSQRDSYGNGLDHNQLHAYMWAVKPHYYSTHFYNWPYTFGLLFGLGLYAAYQEDPERFRAGYDDLLSSTGLSDAAHLARRFGIEIGGPDFWSSSLGVLSRRIDEFEAVAGDAGNMTAAMR